MRGAVMRKSVVLVAVALALSVAAAASMAYQRGFETVTSTGVVYRVIDADTMVVNLSDPSAYRQMVALSEDDPDRTRYLNDRFESIRVRLANVDTPESVHPDASRNTAEGRQLSEMAKTMLEGQPTRVTCFDWGDFGRAICSLEKPSGRDFGEWLISEGHSPYVTRWGRHPYLDEMYRNAANQE